jgi:hypothetical protein
MSGLKTRASRPPASVSADEVIDFRGEGDREEVLGVGGGGSVAGDRSFESERSAGSTLDQGTPLPEGMPDDCCFYVFINSEAFEVKHSKYKGRKPFVLIEDDDCEGKKIKNKLIL